MWWRLGFFLLWQGVGALLGGALAPAAFRPEGALAGAVVGSLAWFAIDFARSARLLRWLRAGAGPAAAPVLRGAWGEACDRTRRLLRLQDQRNADSERRLREFLAAIQASPNGVVLLDPEGRIEWCNQTASEHLGFDTQRDLMQHIGNLLRDPAFIHYVAAGDYRHDVVVAGPGGSGRPGRLSIQLHPYGEGRRLLLSRDVTALEQADAMRRDFVANVSHEIRTPLTVLSGFVETLQNLPLDAAERSHYLDLMAQQAGRMQTLVNDLLTLSRLEGSPPPGAGEWTPANQLAQRVYHDAQMLSRLLAETGGQPAGAAAHRLTLERAPEDRALAVSGSADELLSAMSNLAGNAVRYTPAGGEIRLGWTLLPDGAAEFSVQDSGPGIAPEHIPRLTERFYRVDRSRSRETGGTGLGLAIVKHVAQRHGAALRIASQPGKGSRFAIVLPASRVRVAPVRQEAALDV